GDFEVHGAGLIAIEDKRFYDHKGVDWYRTAGAFVEMFARMETSYGGSTITQQLIKNLTGEDQITIQRKLSEICGALELEKKYDKQEIMEWYLNAVYFGEGCYGVQAAAQTYFGKDVSELSLAECAAIVGITNKPTYYDPFYNEQNNKDRQETILREMYEQEYIDYETYKAAVAEELVFARSPGESTDQTIYTYYEEVVINDVIRDLMDAKGIGREAATTLLYNGGYQIYCCMDQRIQGIVDSIYTDLSQIPRPGNRTDQQFQSAIVIMDPYDGRILALCGGVGNKTRNFPLDRAVPESVNGFDYGGATRSPGSSFKPIASYGPAVDLGLITPGTLVNDASDVRLRGTSWYPHNDSYQNYGVITIEQGLMWSLNTVAAQIVDVLPGGPQTSYDYLTERLGVTSLVPDDIAYAPMALGQLTYGISVREMCQAYCAFVNDGVFTYSRTYSMVTDAKGNVVLDDPPKTIQAFQPNTAYTMTYMLKKNVEEGIAGEARLWSIPVGGKTGTSGDMKDRWFAGVTPYYVAVVWTGYDIPETISIGGNPAAQLWRKVMGRVLEGYAWKDFTWPYLGDNTGVFGLDENDTDPGDAIVVEDDDGGWTLIEPDEGGGGDDGGDGAEIIFG
ncbi:MAG: transglycosylase domain-containing protein, partial [Oscillospiraceae bacterium]|nr:transglycosylase domain-containing protein [Oscillospiraceae bacterium]